MIIDKEKLIEEIKQENKHLDYTENQDYAAIFLNDDSGVWFEIFDDTITINTPYSKINLQLSMKEKR